MPPPNLYGRALCSEVMELAEQIDEIDAATTYSTIMEICSDQDIPFIDDSFPHTIDSLKSTDDDNEKWGTDLAWLRPEEIAPHDESCFEWSVFRDPQPSDITQGQLGNCGLISALALIAERPDFLERIILTKEYTPIGAYQIRLCIDGEWKVTVVDDFFPCKDGALAFAKGSKNQLWVSLIEKALAKQYGTYSAIAGRSVLEWLSVLTGAPCEYINTGKIAEDPDQGDYIWAKLLSSREASFVMGCGCADGIRKVSLEEYEEKGLVSHHAYSILDVRQEGVNRLIRLRNPWGTFVWKDEWSDDWPQWDSVLKERLLGGEYQSGSFWMPFDKFIQYYNRIDIAKVRSHAGWTELRIPIQMGYATEEANSSIRFFVENSTEFCFTLFQNVSTTYADEVDLMISVHHCKNDSNIGELVCRSPRKVENYTTTGDVILEQGEYVVIAHSFLTLGAKKINGCLAIYSSRKIYADIFPTSPAHIKDSLIHISLMEGEHHLSLPGVHSRYLTLDFAGFYLMVDNTLENRWAHVNSDCSGSENVISSRGALKVADVVPPMTRQIIIILTQFAPSIGFSWAHNLSLVTCEENVLPSGGRHIPEFDGNALVEIHNPQLLSH